VGGPHDHARGRQGNGAEREPAPPEPKAEPRGADRAP